LTTDYTDGTDGEKKRRVTTDYTDGTDGEKKRRLTTDYTDGTDGEKKRRLTTDYTDGTDGEKGGKNVRTAENDVGMKRMLYEDLSHEIIGAGMTVLNELKPGLDEKVYENALVIELKALGHRVEQQKAFTVEYRGRQVGQLIPDLIVDECVIVDPKVVSDFNDTHMAQMTGYLAVTGLRLALLLSFKEARFKWKRVVR
jgi:GxxExxY protein